MRPRPLALSLGASLLCAGVILWRLLPQTDLLIGATLRLTAADAAVSWLVIATKLGGAAVMIPAALLVVVFLAMTHRAGSALWMFVTIASGRLIVEGLKPIFDRPRPSIDYHLVATSNAAFPSSHSAGTMLTVAAIGVACRAPRWFWIAGGAWVLLIGLSRLLLGVHWPSDVLAGWGIGMVWVALLARYQFEPSTNLFRSGSLRNRD